MITLLGSALLLGLAGSLHCIGMCGPLYIRFQLNEHQTVWSKVSYFGGKTLSYGVLGLLAGILGKAFSVGGAQLNIFNNQQILAVVAGVALLLITMYPFLLRKISFNPSLQKGFQKLQQVSHRIPTMLYSLLSGVLNGLLPCGLVYAALAMAVVNHQGMDSFLFMVSFGIGTIPSLVLLQLINKGIGMKGRTMLRNSSFYLSLVVAAFLILRGMNLGIPYVSPHMDTHTHEMSCCERPRH